MYNYCYTVRGGRLKGVKSGGTAESKAHSSCKGCEPFFITLKALHKNFLWNLSICAADYTGKFLYKASAIPTRSETEWRCAGRKKASRWGKSDRDSPQTSAGKGHTGCGRPGMERYYVREKFERRN